MALVPLICRICGYDKDIARFGVWHRQGGDLTNVLCDGCHISVDDLFNAGKQNKEPKQKNLLCKKCNVNKHESDFYRNRLSITGHHCYCKECYNKLYGGKSKKNSYPAHRTPRTAATPVTDKACTKCKVSKPLDDFFPAINRPGGFSRWCKQCHTEAKVAKARVAAETRAKAKQFDHVGFVLVVHSIAIVGLYILWLVEHA